MPILYQFLTFEQRTCKGRNELSTNAICHLKQLCLIATKQQYKGNRLSKLSISLLIMYVLYCMDSKVFYNLCTEINYRGSPLSTIFGTWKKQYYAKLVLLGTTQLISTSTNCTTQKFHQYYFYYIAIKNSTSGNRTSGNRTKRGPPVVELPLKPN